MEKSIFGTYTSYSQASSGEKNELQEIDFAVLKKSRYDHCQYKFEKIRIRVFTKEGHECIKIDFDNEVSPLADFRLFLDFYFIEEDDFYIRKEIESGNIFYLASRGHFSDYSDKDLQLYAVDTSLHEAFHYLYMRSSVRKRITSDREEFLANIYAYSFLKNMYDEDTDKKIHSYLEPETANRFPREIASSFNSELAFLEYIRNMNDKQKIYDEILGLISS